MMDTMTAEGRALHYIRWHAAAYGAPAPMDEIADQLHKRHGLTETQSCDLLVRMQRSGQIAYTEGTTLEGWHEVTPNAGYTPKCPIT